MWNEGKLEQERVKRIGRKQKVCNIIEDNNEKVEHVYFFVNSVPY